MFVRVVKDVYVFIVLKATLEERGLFDITWSNTSSSFLLLGSRKTCKRILFRLKDKTTHSEWIVMSDVEDGRTDQLSYSMTQSKALKLRLDTSCMQISVVAQSLVDVTTCKECVGSVSSEASCDASVQYEDFILPEFHSLNLLASEETPGYIQP